MTRPKSKIPQMSKSITILVEDEKYIVDNGLYCKNIISLGVQAHKNGWSQHKETIEIQNLNTRVEKLSLVLESYAKKFEKLCLIIEKGLNLKIKDDLSNIDELVEKINSIYENGE